MTTNEAKKDAAAKLRAAGIQFTRLSARTVSFEGFGYGSAVFVAIHGANVPAGWKSVFASVPKPSEGGYVPELGQRSTVDGNVPMFS